MKSLSLALINVIAAGMVQLRSADALLVSPSCHRLGTSRSYRAFDNCKTFSQLLSTATPLYTTSALRSSAAVGESDGNIATKDDASSSADVPLSLTLTAGIASTLLGFIYAKCMKKGFKLLWKTIPNSLLNASSANIFATFIQAYPAMYIVLMTTFGGATVAFLSSKLPNLYSAHDFVHILSNDDQEIVNGDAEKDVFPSAKAILPVMGLCLVTSLSGFSLGPEAPMVTVGSLAGASLARKFYKSQASEPSSKLPSKTSLEKTLAYAGAAGSLTGFMNIPLAGPIFALEMTSRQCGVATSALQSWTTAIMASLVGISFVRGVMMPSAGIGGHFDYISKAAVGAVSGREMIAVGLGCGVGGAVVGTCFHSAVRFMKKIIWPKTSFSEKENNSSRCSAMLKKVLVALAIGLLSTQYPQTMFWGEGSLQCMVDGQCTPFAATPHGLPTAMIQWAKVNPNQPLSSWFSAAQVGLAKFFAIALASAAKYPGGVIFPLLSNGAGISQSIVQGLGFSNSMVSPMVVMSFMAATLTSITRTPLATCLILAMTASSITPLSIILPGVLLASYISVFVSEKLSKESFFDY